VPGTKTGVASSFQGIVGGNRLDDRREKPGSRSSVSGRHIGKGELDDIRGGTIDAKTGKKATSIPLRSRRPKAPKSPDFTYGQRIYGRNIEPSRENVIDHHRIRATINELGKLYQILEIAIERWNATQLSTQLTDDGSEVVHFGQGNASMNCRPRSWRRSCGPRS
jgi:hypothetical protein